MTRVLSLSSFKTKSLLSITTAQLLCYSTRVAGSNCKLPAESSRAELEVGQQLHSINMSTRVATLLTFGVVLSFSLSLSVHFPLTDMALQNRDNLSVDLFGVKVKVKQCAIQSVAVSKLGFVLPAGVKVFTAAAAAAASSSPQHDTFLQWRVTTFRLIELIQLPIM